jgi:hypothetical protein
MAGAPSLAELLTVGPRLVGVPKVKSAFATDAVRANAKTNVSEIVFLFLNIIHISILVLFLGLPYHDRSLGSGAQTIRPGWAGPVSQCLVA